MAPSSKDNKTQTVNANSKMELSVLGSSSRGNCYILQNDAEAIIIECGLPLLEAKKALAFNISKICGCLLTHEHGDHSGHIQEFLNSRLPIYASPGTISAIETRGAFLPIPLKACVKKQIGNFTILPFDVKHDAAEPLGFLIKHPEIGLLLFATDTYYLPYTFAGLTNIMIECNYQIDILEKGITEGRIPATLRDRTLQSHMSLDTCKEALLANDLTKVNNIILLHLSDNNSNAGEFKDDIHKATGKRVHIADKGLKITLSKTPF